MARCDQGRKKHHDDRRNKLFLISKNLGKPDRDALRFLVWDILPKAILDRDVEAPTIFEALEERELISESSSGLLVECLQIIGRFDLVERHFKNDIKDKKTIIPTGEISSFRLALFDIAVDMDSDEMKELLNQFKDIRKSYRERVQNTFDLLILLEERCIFNQEDTGTLQNALSCIERKDLVKRLKGIHDRRRPKSLSGHRIVFTPLKLELPMELTDEFIRQYFNLHLRNEIVSGVYAGEITINSTQTSRHVLRIENTKDEILACLRRFNQLLQANPKIWLCFWDPQNNQAKYLHVWDCSLFFLKWHFPSPTPEIEEFCNLRLTDMQIYRPGNAISRSTLINFIGSYETPMET